MIDPTRLAETVRAVVRAERRDSQNDQASKAAIDSGYAGGPPKIIEAGAVGTYEHSVSPSFFWGFPTASESTIKQPIGDADVLMGGLYDIPSGVVYNADAYKLLPSDHPESSTTVANDTTTRVRGMKFLLPAPLLVAKVVFEVVTATAGALAAIGIYSSNGGNLLINTGAVNCSSNGIKEVTISPAYLLQPGWYWYMWTINDTTTTLRAIALGANVLNLLNQGKVQRGNAANTATAAVLPATLGTITSASFNMPFCKLQA